jgi:cyclopropane fatty-acyl-phospholipid synthase-like methyltransferase
MLQKLFFNLAYYQKPVWDTGISPPELVDYITTHTPGKALELGCGTGTNAITLAKSGWRVTGVDFALRAVKIARNKAQRTRVQVDFQLDNVTRLESITGPFDLILDIGCFHSLPTNTHPQYMANIERLLSPTGTYLLYVFFKKWTWVHRTEVTEEAVRTLAEI